MEMFIHPKDRYMKYNARKTDIKTEIYTDINHNKKSMRLTQTCVYNRANVYDQIVIKT